MGGGTGFWGFVFEGSSSEPLISFWPVSVSRAFEVISSKDASVTATDSFPENEGETRSFPGNSLRTGLDFGFTGSGTFILKGASSLGTLVVWSFWDRASTPPFEDIDFDRGGATGLSTVPGTLVFLLESISTTDERGLGLGAGLETDGTLGSGASWSSQFVAFALEPQTTGADSSDSRDVSFKSFNDVPLTPCHQKETSKLKLALSNKMKSSYFCWKK